MLIHPLNETKTGQEIRIEAIPDTLKAELIRLGLCIGDFVTCVASIPNGPTVLQKDLIEIAIGDKQAQNIIVSIESKDGEAE